MKFLQMSQAAGKLVLMCLLFSTAASHAADVKVEATQAASAATTNRVTPKVAPGKVVPKVATSTGAIAGKGGDNQYPAGTIPLPPKPKKEGLEAAGAVKAKAAQP